MAKNKRQKTVDAAQHQLSRTSESVETKEIELKVEVVEVANPKEELQAKPVVIKNKKVEITKTERAFGKCKVVADKITIYTKNNLAGKVTKTTLDKGKTFYFDAVHTKGSKIYVSWNEVCGRGYALLKDLETGKAPVVKIQ